MTRLAVMLAVAVVSYAVDVWAADIIPTKAQPATVESAPTLCTDAWNFIASKCQLAWQGITVFGRRRLSICNAGEKISELKNSVHAANYTMREAATFPPPTKCSARVRSM
jgi:hypothetical protein